MTQWRVGSKVPINVYDGDTPVCQCQTAEYAALIVEAVNLLLIRVQEQRDIIERRKILAGPMNTQ